MQEKRKEWEPDDIQEQNIEKCPTCEEYYEDYCPRCEFPKGVDE